MASFSSSSSSYHPNLNCSKTQMCLFKILHTISSIPPSKEESSPINNKGVGIDLNQELCSVEQSVELELELELEPEPDASATDQEGGEKAEVGVREESVETKVQSFEEDNNGGDGGGGETASFAERGQDGNCLDLLIEAARVVAEEEGRRLGAELRASQGSSSEEEERVKIKKKQKDRWVVMDLYDGVSEEREPVVRSKRGRSQALPQRFRDSVVEPLKRRRRTVVKR